MRTFGELPPLRWPHQSYASAVTLLGTLLGTIGVLCLTASWSFLGLVKLGAWIARCGWKLQKRCLLPSGIVTFGDLARVVALSVDDSADEKFIAATVNGNRSFACRD
jgi:hypothetical protein